MLQVDFCATGGKKGKLENPPWLGRDPVASGSTLLKPFRLRHPSSPPSLGYPLSVFNKNSILKEGGLEDFQTYLPPDVTKGRAP